MTKEEQLRQEAEEYAREWLYHVKDLELQHKEDDKPEYIRIKEAYLAGAEPREKRVAELEAQIEKMKCCENCNNFMHRIDHRCNTECKNLSKWELAE